MADVKSEYAFSYELGVDIDTAYPASDTPTWQPIRFAKSVAPSATPTEVDAQTYDDLGAEHPIKLGESWQLDITVQQHRLEDGKYLLEIEKILAAAGPEAMGETASVHVRWYDKPATGKPNPTDAYEGYGTVTVTREQTGTKDLGGFQVTVKGQGPRKPIANPATTTTPAAPPVTPAGA